MIKELKEILKLHELWLLDPEDGRKADLSDADLSDADLRYANLRYANLSNADLRYANLYNANFSDANLSNAYLSNANLSNAYLSNANLYNADLSNADLYNANLRYANLSDANLRYANLSGIYVNLHTVGYFALCPEDGFTAYKKCRDDVIVKLFIPAYAKKSNATTRKCRADRARVLDVFGAEHGISSHDSNFIYRKGDLLTVEDFDEDRWNECSTGIHFFLTREEAELYM